MEIVPSEEVEETLSAWKKKKKTKKGEDEEKRTQGME